LIAAANVAELSLPLRVVQPLENIMPIVIEGLKELSDKLATMPAKAAKRYLSRCGEKAAQVVVDALEQTVPVDYGYLEEAITWQKKWLDGNESTMDIRIGPMKGAFWGSLQEFGTAERTGWDKNGKPFHHGATPPLRWMSRAWESCRDECLDVFATEAIGILMDLENKE
jgi:HK97 gp10 family phage protein